MKIFRIAMAFLVAGVWLVPMPAAGDQGLSLTVTPSPSVITPGGSPVELHVSLLDGGTPVAGRIGVEWSMGRSTQSIGLSSPTGREVFSITVPSRAALGSSRTIRVVVRGSVPGRDASAESRLTLPIQDQGEPLRLHVSGMYEAGPNEDPLDVAFGSVASLRRVSGVATDGVSRLVLEARVLGIQPDDPMEYQLEAFVGDGLNPPNDGHLSNVHLGRDGRIRALYVPPAEFGGDRSSPDPSDQIPLFGQRMRETTVTWRLHDTSGRVLSEERQMIALWRPPMVLIHGLWAGPETWTRVDTLTRAGFDTYVANYGGSSWLGVRENVPALSNAVEDALDSLRSSVAIQRVDVVAHSQGGLISRWYIAQTRGRTVRKLITVGTPHQGSPLANVLVKCVELQQKTGVTCPALAVAPGPFGLSHYDLSLDSAVVTGLGRVESSLSLSSRSWRSVGRFAIVGTDPAIAGRWSPFIGALDVMFEGDGIVPVWSQQMNSGGLEISVTHVNETADLRVYAAIIRALNAPLW